MIKKILRKLRSVSGKYTEIDFQNSLKEKGVVIGERTVFFDFKSNIIDIQRPWLLTIGSYCKICHGVIILTHDYSRSVVRRVYGEIIESAKKTIIGNNVFIGMNSIILMGTVIGDNCIIGAGSIVSGIFPDNVVIAGNPAKIICTLEEYYLKRKNNCKKEALCCAKAFQERYDKMPTVNEMGAFFPLYIERDLSKLREYDIRTNLSGDDEDDIIRNFLITKSAYTSFDEFINEVQTSED